MRFNILISCLLLVGCTDFAFDCFGRPPSNQNSGKGNSSNVYVGATGEVVQCTNDSQCGADFSCVKDPDSFTGTCAQLIIISK